MAGFFGFWLLYWSLSFLFGRGFRNFFWSVCLFYWFTYHWLFVSSNCFGLWFGFFIA